MLELTLTLEDGSRVTQRRLAPVVIGRDVRADLRLVGWRVAREHARLYVQEGAVGIDDLGSLAGTLLNGRRVVQHVGVQPDDDIVIGGHRLRVRHVPAVPSPPPTDTAPPAASASVAAGAATMAAPATPAVAVAVAESALRDPRFDEWRRRVHAGLLEAIDLRRRDISRMSDAALREEAQQLVAALVADLAAELPADLDRDALCLAVVDEAVGLGPLEALMQDAAVSEIMVNRHDEVFVERGGRLYRHATGFSSDAAVLGIIERIVAPTGRRIDESSPMVDARLKDGSRVNAIIPPIALKGPSLTIRRFPAQRLQMHELVERGALDQAMARFLALCVRERKNIVVAGGTGSGKTTLLNVLSGFIPAGERIVTIEDAAELRLAHEHLVSLEARPPNVEGRGAVSIRDLVRNALRMRPDRIVVGECRGAEALDMLQAMNTGHEGSLTTLHANTPRDALARLETLVLMAGVELPLAAVREQIAASVDILVQQVRSPSGVRRLAAIVEVTGVESGRIQLQTLFESLGDGAGFRSAGVPPSFYESWRATGVLADAELFFHEAPGAARELRP